MHEFDGYRLDTARRQLLTSNGLPVPLMPKALETLVYLVEHAGQTVSKDDLLRAVWPDTVVEENNLTQNISALRKALGESGRAPIHRHRPRPGLSIRCRGASGSSQVRIGRGTGCARYAADRDDAE
jgi:DNA-binding winged helix-turn-helix (wHTH) protein